MWLMPVFLVPGFAAVVADGDIARGTPGVRQSAPSRWRRHPGPSVSGFFESPDKTGPDFSRAEYDFRLVTIFYY
jgi:hypothetical protein